MENKEQKEKKIELRYSEACLVHRRKQLMPELSEQSRKLPCDFRRGCYCEGCPIYKEESKKELPKRTPENPLGINLEVFEEIKPDKPKEKKISKETEEFLYLQSRVIGKLSWNPQIWQALDKLSVQEILDRLLGKTGLEGVATHVGGDMQLKASPKTKKLFENLEKQFADEDEKKGKAPPPDYETESYGKQEPEPWVEIIDKTDRDYARKFREENDFREKKEEKKNVKKIDKK